MLADKVDKEMRRRAKVINFGLMYGMGVNALRANLNSTKEEAQKYLEEYFNKFSGLAKYLENTKREAESKGYTETFFGRRRHFEGLKSKLPYIKAMAERMAINAPIQGTEADIIKIAMVKINDFIEKEKLDEKIRLTLQVHDELVFEIDEKIVTEVEKEIRKIMENIINPEKVYGIVCKAEVSAGDNWKEMRRGE